MKESTNTIEDAYNVFYNLVDAKGNEDILRLAIKNAYEEYENTSIKIKCDLYDPLFMDKSEPIFAHLEVENGLTGKMHELSAEILAPFNKFSELYFSSFVGPSLTDRGDLISVVTADTHFNYLQDKISADEYDIKVGSIYISDIVIYGKYFIPKLETLFEEVQNQIKLLKII